MSNPVRCRPPPLLLILLLLLLFLVLLDQASPQSWNKFRLIEKLAKVDKVEQEQLYAARKFAIHQRKLELYATAADMAKKSQELYLSSNPLTLDTKAQPSYNELESLNKKFQSLLKELKKLEP